MVADPPVPATDPPPGETGPDLARGVLRLFAQMGQAGLDEVPLTNGRRVDVMTLGRDGRISVIEIKVSVADFRGDAKWPDYADFCDFLYFAVPRSFPHELIPNPVGLIIADRYGGAILRPAPETKMNAARRKNVTLRFARLAAQRLNRLIDP